METTERDAKWSVLLLRGPSRRVRQLQVSAKNAVLLPAAATLIVAGFVAGLELCSLHRIHELESRLAAESELRAAAVADHNDESAALNRQLADMTRQAGDLTVRLAGLSELEYKLSQLVERYDASLPTQTVKAVRQSFSASDRAIAGAAADFGELSRIMDTMSKTMASNLRKAEQRRADLASIPSGWPTVSRKITSGFGYRTDPISGGTAFHAGVDIAGDLGDPVFAAGDGGVEQTGFEPDKGNYIIITHRTGLESWYLHLRSIGVEPGDAISRGQRLGELGNTGRSTGSHLHFQIMSRNEPVNPLGYIRSVKEDRNT